MSHTNLFKSLLAVTALMLGACDELDETQSQDLELQEAGLESPVSNEIDAPAPDEIDAPPPEMAAHEATSFDLVDAGKASAGPPGKACCADCGDYSAYWYNLGYGDNCNHTAAQWCSNHGYSFINAEWRTPYSAVQCY